MSRFTDSAYLREEQYRDDANLRARMDPHRRFATNPQPWQRWVFDRLDLPDEADVLEVGCGPGRLWEENLDRIPDGWRPTLVDLSAGMVERARAALGERAAYAVADAQELPFPDERFDAAVANHMLYHVPDRPRALRELARVLQPAGRFYCATNGGDHLREIKALFERQSPWEFRLETAARELADVFADVTVEVYPSRLEITEVEPVVAFVRSMDHGEVEGLEERIRGEIERAGWFRVTTATGLLSARKP